MKKRRLLLPILLVSTLTSGLVHAATPRVDKRISNLFMQNFKNEGFSYVVDPYAQLCLVTGHRGGIIEIECEILKRRSEWYDIIYWIEGEEKK